MIQIKENQGILGYWNKLYIYIYIYIFICVYICTQSRDYVGVSFFSSLLIDVFFVPPPPLLIMGGCVFTSQNELFSENCLCFTIRCYQGSMYGTWSSFASGQCCWTKEWDSRQELVEDRQQVGELNIGVGIEHMGEVHNS